MFWVFAAASLASSRASATPLRAWWIADPHVDPFYTPGAPGEACYCRTKASCPARPSSDACVASADVFKGNDTARPFGNAESDCETSPRVLESALAFAKETTVDPSFVLHSGDFCAYMLETPCDGSAAQGAPGSSEAGLLRCLRDGYAATRRAFPKAPALPVLGNHDTVVLPNGAGRPDAALFGPTEEMAWLYGPLAELWAKPDAIGCSRGGEFSCAEANKTIREAGYYGTRLLWPGVNVTFLAINTNYWATDNAALLPGSEAEALGEAIFAWAVAAVGRASARGDRVAILGHVPPYGKQWRPNLYRRWVGALTPFFERGLQLVHFLGHMHVDMWQILRTCGADGDECSGDPLGVAIVGPGLTTGFPASNPALRRLDFSPDAFLLETMDTFVADLHEANEPGGDLSWELLYSFADAYGIADLSAASVAGLVDRMAAPESPEWQAYRGADAGTYFCKGWRGDLRKKADSPCGQGCTGAAKAKWLDHLNGTAINRTFASSGVYVCDASP